MRKRVVALVAFGLLCVMAAHAGGKKDNESYYAESPDGFTAEIDIKNRKPGKYNFYIEARDKANNRTLAGPDNIWIDPVSDLPVTHIINPKPNMHVQGNLNIVGSCFDDDAVDFVDFTVHRGRPGDRGEELVSSRAEGKEFWSYFLDTTDTEIWTDGVYTITAWGTDIFGVSGRSADFNEKDHKFHQVSFHLDRKKPQTRVSSHAIGALVSGKIALKGVVSDGNGVKALQYSLDGGNVYRPLAIKFDKRYDVYQWSVDIDTRALEDGRQVVWFRAYDGMGTLGLAAHLLFVNNTNPAVEIAYPQADTPVGGIFTMAGSATHPVGLQSLTWKMGKESGIIDLVIGNAWWVQEFDIRGLKGNSVEIEFRATDLSGNVTVTKRKQKVDQTVTMPRVVLESPVAGALTHGDMLVIKGVATDNDAVASIFYSIDGGAAEEVPCSGYFQFAVEGLAAGSRTVDVWAKDIHGIEGPKTQVKNVIVPGPYPRPQIETFRMGARGAPAQFATGLDISTEGMVMDIAIPSAVPISDVTVAFGERGVMSVPVKGGKDNVFRGSFQVPPGLSGLVRIDLTATDRYGRKGSWAEYAYASGPFPPTENIWIRTSDESPVQYETEGVYPRLLINKANTSVVGLAGFKAQSATLEGAGSENFGVSVDGWGRVHFQTVQGIREGSYGPITVHINGATGQAQNPTFNVLVDYAEAVLEIDECPEWVQDTIPVKFRAYSANNVKNIAYSTDLGFTWIPLLNSSELSALSASTVLERDLDISALPDGMSKIYMVAVSESNRETVKILTVHKDTEAPSAELIVPISEASVNGTIHIGINLKEAGKLKRITYEKPASEDSPAITQQIFPDDEQRFLKLFDNHPPRFLELLMDSLEMPLDEHMKLVFEDEAGNVGEFADWHFIIDNEADIPIVEIVLPFDNEVMVSDFEVSGIMFDDDAIGKVFWFIDDNEEQELDIGDNANAFSIYVYLSTLTDNEHSITVIAEDIYGVRSEPAVRDFRVSLSEPMASITTPSFDMIVSDMIEMSGGSYDENGIAKVEVSLDNGHSFNETRINAVDNSAEWFYEFNSKIIKDGPHVVFIRVIDNYGIQAMYSGLLNIDNTFPEVTLDSPANGMVTTGPLNILGQVTDVNLEGKEIRLRSLDGHRIPETGYSIYRAGQENILKEYMDLSPLPDGLYNIEIQAVDKADNITVISRNFELNRETQRNYVDIRYPLNGESIHGSFNLYGVVGGNDPARRVTLKVNGVDMAISDITWTGFYRLGVVSEFLQPGWNEIIVSSVFGGEEILETTEVVDKDGNVSYVQTVVGELGGTTVSSDVRTVFYQENGPWVTIESLTMGDFAFNRPWLVGRAGYVMTDEDMAIIMDKNADKMEQGFVKGKTLSHVDISFDNGNTFTRASGSLDADADWRFRVETGDMQEGYHYLIVRAVMKNGEAAVTRTVLQVDKTPPQIRLIAPQAGGRYNNELEFSALASDDVALASLSYHLRVGDKFFYEVPGFLQGMYFEVTIPPFIRQITNDAPVLFAGGATYMDFGFGLSFFDDNVKIQLQYGFHTQDLYEQLGGEKKPSGTTENTLRYGGHVLGLKILANIYNLPFGAVIGPDFEWLKASFSMGANFSLFDMGRQGYTQSGNPTWMGALLLQIEFPKMTIPERERFRTFSLFTEGQLWFVPTDVDAKAYGINVVIPHMIMGVRMYIF